MAITLAEARELRTSFQIGFHVNAAISVAGAVLASVQLSIGIALGCVTAWPFMLCWMLALQAMFLCGFEAKRSHRQYRRMDSLVKQLTRPAADHAQSNGQKE